jgi:hypothetical protein
MSDYRVSIMNEVIDIVRKLSCGCARFGCNKATPGASGHASLQYCTAREHLIACDLAAEDIISSTSETRTYRQASTQDAQLPGQETLGPYCTHVVARLPSPSNPR